MAWLWLGLTMPYHAYAPLARDPEHESESSLKCNILCVCVQSEIYAAARMQAGSGGCGGEGGGGRRTGCLAGILFYFICINHVACDAIEKYICLLGNFALAFPCTRAPPPYPPSAAPLQGVQGHGMARSRTCNRAGRRRRLGKCIRFARAVNVKTMAQVFGCQLRKGKCAGKIA